MNRKLAVAAVSVLAIAAGCSSMQPTTSPTLIAPTRIAAIDLPWDGTLGHEMTVTVDRDDLAVDVPVTLAGAPAGEALVPTTGGGITAQMRSETGLPAFEVVLPDLTPAITGGGLDAGSYGTETGWMVSESATGIVLTPTSQAAIEAGPPTVAVVEASGDDGIARYSTPYQVTVEVA